MRYSSPSLQPHVFGTAIPRGDHTKVDRPFQPVAIDAQGNERNGKSILDLTTLAAECGTRLDLVACVLDAVGAVEALAVLCGPKGISLIPDANYTI